MSTYVSVVISPATTTRPVVMSVSQATRPVGVVGEHRVEDGVRDLVGDLVRVALGDRLGREGERAIGHGGQASCRTPRKAVNVDSVRCRAAVRDERARSSAGRRAASRLRAPGAAARPSRSRRRTRSSRPHARPASRPRGTTGRPRASRRRRGSRRCPACVVETTNWPPIVVRYELHAVRACSSSATLCESSSSAVDAGGRVGRAA